MRQDFLKDKTGTIRLSVYEDNIQVVPSSATIVLYKPDGATLQVSDTATVGSSGEITYPITATHTATLGESFKAVFSYVVSGTTYTEEILFDVVRSILSIPITDDDLFKELEALRKMTDQKTSTATAGSSSTLTDTARKEVNDYWTGGNIRIVAGTGVGQTRVITDFVQSTGVITVSPNFVTTPDTTSKYIIYKSYTEKIQNNFEKLKQKIYDMGNRPALIIDSSQIAIPLVYLTIQNICLDYRATEGDKWDLLFQDYSKMFEVAYNNLRYDYDIDESGFIQGDEKQMSTAFRVGRS